MTRNTNADSLVVIIVEVVKVRTFGENKGELARYKLINERLGAFGDEGVFFDGFFGLGDESKDFVRIKIAIFEFHEVADTLFGI